ncbi:MAG: ABC transporter ATP-binding protein [Chloroflexi bacterium]|nr:ABC transporter ATP-binding protein [Chloroflexota bacterium]
MSPAPASTAAGSATIAPAGGNGPDGPLLTVKDLQVYFPILTGVLRRRTGWVKAVDGVSFHIDRGETLGLVGESGSGKTTIGRTIVRIMQPLEGSIHLGGSDLLALRGEDLRRRRRRFQMVFQDPYSSLDPRQTVGEILAEPLRVHNLASGKARQARVVELLDLVGLEASFVERYPHEFSGGQRQRIGIARALAVEPELIVCDEPISALDVSIQAQVINLLERLQADLGLTYLFIAHDLAVVRHIADRVAVMYLGKIVEVAPSDLLYQQPLHPYTVALLSAVPVPDARTERSRRRIILRGDIPSPANPPTGCRFHTRCWLRERLKNPEICATTDPPLAPIPQATPDQTVACHFASELNEHRPRDVVPEVEETPVIAPVQG